jgi:hypothetical protein
MYTVVLGALRGVRDRCTRDLHFDGCLHRHEVQAQYDALLRGAVVSEGAGHAHCAYESGHAMHRLGRARCGKMGTLMHAALRLGAAVLFMRAESPASETKNH